MYRKIFEFIDSCEETAVELQIELTKRPAVSPVSGGEGELDKCLFLEKWLKEHGIDTLERYDAPDPSAKGGVRPNLTAVIEGTNGALPCFWIMSHLDVVPAGDLSLWNSDPWIVTRKDGKLTGRGVEDNQQGLVSSVLAALAFVKLKIRPEHTLKLLFIADEECNSNFGINWLMENKRQLFKKGDFVLVPDSGDPAGETIEIAEKNSLWLKVRTSGVQAHAAYPEKGRNACLAGADLMLRLRKDLMKKFSARDSLFDPDYSTIEPTKKEANVPNINTIPSEDVFYMDIRLLPRYRVNDLLEEARRVKLGIEQEYGVQVDLSIVQSKESEATPADSPIVKMLSVACKQVLGRDTRTIGIGGGTVAAFLRNEEIDAVGWCTLDNSLHQPNEYCVIKNMLDDAKVMAHIAAQSKFAMQSEFMAQK
ncbi:MAG: M20 family metallo-hydrolase [Spirochaetaceae bacterium]|jgi:succinyl-diaminopimelate desuccinylase|nr:M20 family metallo-hydrolase [Spirochaetaceae bacterium]